MTQFQEGQEVEVQCNEYEGEPLWRRGAKILCYAWPEAYTQIWRNVYERYLSYGNADYNGSCARPHPHIAANTMFRLVVYVLSR